MQIEPRDHQIGPPFDQIDPQRSRLRSFQRRGFIVRAIAVLISVLIRDEVRGMNGSVVGVLVRGPVREFVAFRAGALPAAYAGGSACVLGLQRCCEYGTFISPGGMDVS